MCHAFFDFILCVWVYYACFDFVTSCINRVLLTSAEKHSGYVLMCKNPVMRQSFCVKDRFYVLSLTY